MGKAEIINFEDAKLKRDIDKTINKLQEIYQDIIISASFQPGYFLEVWFTKDKYVRGERFYTDRLKYSDLEQLLKFHLNNFTHEVYKKIEKEKFGE